MVQPEVKVLTSHSQPIMHRSLSFALEIRLLTMDSTPYDDSSVAVLLTMNEQGCQKKPAAGENRHLLGQYRPATLFGISLWMAFYKKKFP